MSRTRGLFGASLALGLSAAQSRHPGTGGTEADPRAAASRLVGSDSNLVIDRLVLGISQSQAFFICLLLFVAVLVTRLLHGKKDAWGSFLAFLSTFRSLLVTVFACSIFMIVGPALMMLNKHIMDDLHFHHPIAICSLGLVSSSIVSHIVVLLGLGEIREESRKMVAGTAWFKVAGPIGLMKALTMSSGNAVYLHLSFGFIQMLKAFTPLIVMVVMRIAGVKLPTRAAMWCVAAIVLGTMVEVKGELHATAYGVCLMVGSEVFEAVSVVFSQKILQNNRFTVLEGLYITAPAGAFCLLVGVVTLELPEMLATGRYRVPLDYPVTFLCAAVLGVAINFISFLVMQLTSALTMKILNTARSVGLVVVGVVFYGEVHPWVQLCGYAVALIGFAGYNFFQLYPDCAKAVESRVDDYLLCVCASCARQKPDYLESEAKGSPRTPVGLSHRDKPEIGA